MKFFRSLFLCFTGISGILFAGNNPIKNNDPLLKTFIPDIHRVQDKKLQESLANSLPWQHFLQNHPGWWVSFNECSRMPHRATGAPIPSNSSDPAQAAWQFMQNELKDFQLPYGEIQLRNVAENKKYQYVHYQQFHKGLEVLWASAQIKLTKQNEVMLFGIDLYPSIDLNINPALSPAGAITMASNNVQGITYVSTPVLKILPVPTLSKTIEFHLVYELNVENKDNNQVPADYYTLIDAHNGEILYRQNRVAHFHAPDVNINGTVYTLHPYQSVVNIGLEGVRMTIGGNSVFSDSTGIAPASNAGNVTATFSLNGKWSNTKTNGTTPQFTATISGGLNTITFDNDANIRELCGFKSVHEIHNYYKEVTAGQAPNNVMDIVMVTNIDELGSCNAFYNGEVNFYEQAGGCNATSLIADVVYHEYGHGINSDIYSFYGGNFGNGAMGEGYADTWANGLTEDPVLGIGFYQNNASGFVRRYDINKKVYPQDLQGEVHADGEIIAGCWWDVALNFGNVQDRQDLFLSTMAATITGPSGDEGNIFTDVLIETLTNDDNDANLTNGTPRYCEITNAFGLHGITTGGAGAVVTLAHAEPTQYGSQTPVIITTTIPTSALPQGSVATAYYKTDLNPAVTWNSVALNNTSGNNWSATLPSFPAGTILYYYFEIIKSDSCGTYPILTKPFLANDTNPNIPYNMLIGYTQLEIMEFENWQGSWTFGLPGDNATTGMWAYDIPVASLLDATNPSSYVQPGFQNTPGGQACAVTANALAGDAAGTADVDGGLTSLISTPYDLTEVNNPAFTYYRFYSNDQGATPGTDFWKVYISNDNGVNWVEVENTNVSDHNFRKYSLRVADYVSPTSQVVLKFVAEDANDGSLIEALVDDVALWELGETGLSELDEKSITLMPNPACNSVRLSWSGKAPENVVITNSMGAAVSEYSNLIPAKNNIDIPVEELPEGFYFVSLKNSGKTITRKLTVIH